MKSSFDKKVEEKSPKKEINAIKIEINDQSLKVPGKKSTSREKPEGLKRYQTSHFSSNRDLEMLKKKIDIHENKQKRKSKVDQQRPSKRVQFAPTSVEQPLVEQKGDDSSLIDESDKSYQEAKNKERSEFNRKSVQFAAAFRTSKTSINFKSENLSEYDNYQYSSSDSCDHNQEVQLSSEDQKSGFDISDLESLQDAQIDNNLLENHFLKQDQNDAVVKKESLLRHSRVYGYVKIPKLEVYKRRIKLLEEKFKKQIMNK